ncbi:MAG TPA: glycosyltransferase family 1 protein [Chitinophagales bacterium]|nr:glycosyltransferase family 1 protein [Chitinophagales bacterium]
MRIGIEAQRIFRKKKHGMDIVALELIKALQLLDQSNQYFIFVKKGEDACISETPNFKIIEVPGLTYADWEQVFLPIYIRKHKIDVLHCTSNTAPVFCPVPTIITLHDVIFLENKQKGSPLFNLYQQLGWVYRKYIVPASVRQTKHIITVSNYEKERISNTLHIGGDKISVVYNAFGRHFKATGDAQKIESIREKYKLPKEYIFYIGNTDPKKNMPNTLKAYARYVGTTKNALPLVIADVNEKDLETVLEKTGLQRYKQHIQLTGYIYNSDLPFIYAAAKVFLYPSLRESFGIPVLESMACGTPVITSNTSALPEVAGNAALLVDPTDETDITGALRTSLSSESMRSELIGRGFERIRNFSWSLSAINLLRIYQTV